MNSTINIHAEVIERCKRGEESAQFELYKLYNKAMFNTACRICGRQDEAEDVLQEAFLSAFRNIHSYREDASFGTWLKRIVINKSITSLRKKKENLSLEETGYPELATEVEEIRMELSVDKIREALMELADGFRSVLTLYLFEGYDHKEISEILGISESTSKTQYKRGKQKLKGLLEKEVRYG